MTKRRPNKRPRSWPRKRSSPRKARRARPRRPRRRTRAPTTPRAAAGAATKRKSPVWEKNSKRPGTRPRSSLADGPASNNDRPRKEKNAPVRPERFSMRAAPRRLCVRVFPGRGIEDLDVLVERDGQCARDGIGGLDGEQRDLGLAGDHHRGLLLAAQRVSELRQDVALRPREKVGEVERPAERVGRERERGTLARILDVQRDVGRTLVAAHGLQVDGGVLRDRHGGPTGPLVVGARVQREDGPLVAAVAARLGELLEARPARVLVAGHSSGQVHENAVREDVAMLDEIGAGLEIGVLVEGGGTARIAHGGQCGADAFVHLSLLVRRRRRQERFAAASCRDDRNYHARPLEVNHAAARSASVTSSSWSMMRSWPSKRKSPRTRLPSSAWGSQ